MDLWAQSFLYLTWQVCFIAVGDKNGWEGLHYEQSMPKYFSLARIRPIYSWQISPWCFRSKWCVSSSPKSSWPDRPKL